MDIKKVHGRIKSFFFFVKKISVCAENFYACFFFIVHFFVYE